MQHQRPAQKRLGFTIVELIVSLGLFTFVITVTVGALLVLIASNQKQQASQSVMTNLGFALDSMTREIRTGYDYACEFFNNNPNNDQLEGMFDDQETITPDGDCRDGSPGGSEKNTAISFIEGGSSITGPSGARRIAYIIELDNNGAIYRRVGEQGLERITSSGVRITDGEFILTDSDSLEEGDSEQPTITIYLEAEDATRSTTETFRMQTTITQRELDL